MSRFYINSTLSEAQQVYLPQETIRHILVLRLKLNETITLFNGDGSEYLATIIELNKKSVCVMVNKHLKFKNQEKLILNLLLCNIANDKMDLAIQKSVELGVSTITPIMCERSQKLIPEKIARRMEHWQKIIISSCEQCGNNTLPKLNHPVTLSKILQEAEDGLNLILSPQAINKMPQQQQLSSVKLLIGPEGGFSQAELDLAISYGFNPIQLGNLVLRTETAVIAGLTFAQLYYGKWL